jgi:diguanylate cyclase (GGDEF)-like protein
MAELIKKAPQPWVETAGALASGGLLAACGMASAAHQGGLFDLPMDPMRGASLPVSLLVAGAGVGIALAGWELARLKWENQKLRQDHSQAGQERDLAMKQARRLRAQAEGLALMREIHRCTAVPERRERLHRILTLVGDLFEGPDITLFAAAEGPLPILPAAYLRTDPEEELFLDFDVESYAALAEAYGDSEAPPQPRIQNATVTWEGGWLYVQGQMYHGGKALGHAQLKRAMAAAEGCPRTDPQQMLEATLFQLDYGPKACKHAVQALKGGRVLRYQDSSLLARAEGDESLILTVPLLAAQHAFGVLRIRRPSDGFDGPEAGALEEMLIESAKHIALAMKKDEDDRQAITDQLTGLFIKRHFLYMLEHLRALCSTALQGEGKTFSLVLIDIDHFKKVNDTHGHLSGDLVLKHVAAVLRTGLRSGDMAFRYGGEEMAILMPQAGEEAAAQLAERLRLKVERTVFKGEHGQPIPVTISSGVAVYRQGLDAQALISRADRALYSSKHNGRNRVTCWRRDLPDPLQG